MTQPLYFPSVTEGVRIPMATPFGDVCYYHLHDEHQKEWNDNIFTSLLDIPWLDRTDARKECFMSDPIRSYTYGSGGGVRTYTSVPYSFGVRAVLDILKLKGYEFNACFLNRYENERNALGWHADDSPGQDFNHPIVVVSFGGEREIWWRENGQTGVVPAEQRRLLRHGSMFVMPPGFQQTHQHRIPKWDRPIGTRISLTFRKFL